MPGQWYSPVPSVRIYRNSLPVVATGKLAIFDLDGTLIRRQHTAPNKPPRDAYDYDILPRRRGSLQYLVNQGYNLVGVTNQGWGPAYQDIAIKRIQNFADRLTVPMTIFVALSNSKDDPYRKPSPYMWNLIVDSFAGTPITEAFFIGDAAGRKGEPGEPVDFSDADLRWAANVSQFNHNSPPVAFSTPEKFFPQEDPPVLEGDRVMAVLVGTPGSGKSTFVEKVLVPRGYVTAPRVLQELEKVLASGKPVVVDNTNPAQDKRQTYYNLAKQYNYQVVVYHLVREGEAWNLSRAASGGKKVPPVAYGVYYRDFVPPTEENTPGPVYQVW